MEISDVIRGHNLVHYEPLMTSQKETPLAVALRNPHTPYPSVLDFWKIKLEKSSLMNWIFSLFWTWFLQATQAVKIQFDIG